MMDCQTAAMWMAGWVDEQLSPGERELMAAHLKHCDRCRHTAAAMAEQQFIPPNHVLPTGFWDRMDQTLQEVMNQPAPDPKPPKPTRTPFVFGYTVMLLAALGWGLHAHSALQTARAESAVLRAELDRTLRLAAQPVVASPQRYRQAQPLRHDRGTL